ncbi:unnamed protein product, partial [Rotaria sordida]
MPLENQLL